jgi:hypothetical protein
MIARSRKSAAEKHIPLVPERFLAMLPAICRQANMALRQLRGEFRDEMIQEVIANTFLAWVRLVKQGREQVARPTPLTNYALRQVRAGRRTGCRLNGQDVLSPYARRIRNLTIERLDQRIDLTDDWNQQLIEDRTAGPAETAAARLDVQAWFRTLSSRNRRIAKALAKGETTCAAARQFGLSPGRISQLRAWFQWRWERFQGCQQTVGRLR